MEKTEDITYLIQCHKQIDSFNYNLAIDWAVKQLDNKEGENLLILASCDKDGDRENIINYVTNTLEELDLKEYSQEETRQILKFHSLKQIANSKNILANLSNLESYYTEWGYKDEDINIFYMLSHGARELNDIGQNLYTNDDSLASIQTSAIDEANNWLTKNTPI